MGPLLHAPVRRRFWLQPFGLARVLAQRPPALGERSYGAETGVMRRRSICYCGGMGAVPASGPAA